MRVLAVDTSSERGSVCVVDRHEILGEVRIASSIQYSERLFRSIEFLFHYLPFQLSDIDLFAAAAGPEGCAIRFLPALHDCRQESHGESRCTDEGERYWTVHVCGMGPERPRHHETQSELLADRPALRRCDRNTPVPRCAGDGGGSRRWNSGRS